MAEEDRVAPVFIREYQPDPHDQRSILLASNKLLEATIVLGLLHYRANLQRSFAGLGRSLPPRLR